MGMAAAEGRGSRDIPGGKTQADESETTRTSSQAGAQL